jgi:4'-phosphopantetheinyl transferase
VSARPLPFAPPDYSGPPVDIWQIDLDQSAPEDSLSSDERQRADRLQVPLMRRRFVAARTALRDILSGYTGLEPAALRFDYGPTGKPSLAGFDWPQFNLTHCDDLALLAISALPVGIDVERVRPLDALPQMMQIACSPAERQALLALSESRRLRAFFYTWTRKEALMKAHGNGFRLAHELSLPVSDAPQTVHADGWTVYDLPLPGDLLAAVAVQAGV